MELMYSDPGDEKRAHQPGENHDWVAMIRQMWLCTTCGCTLNTLSGKIMREGKRNEG